MTFDDVMRVVVYNLTRQAKQAYDGGEVLSLYLIEQEPRRQYEEKLRLT